MRHLRHLEAVESMGHLGDSAEMSGPLDLSACGIPSEMEERVLSEEDETQLAQPEAIHFATAQAAVLLHLENRGLIARGKLADLVIVDGDPATEIRDTQKIQAVYHRGKKVSGPIQSFVP